MSVLSARTTHSTEFQPDFRDGGHVNLREWEFSLIPLVLKFHLELLAHVRHNDLHLTFGERFAETDATTTMEGYVAVRVALLTIWGQIEFISVIPALW